MTRPRLLLLLALTTAAFAALTSCSSSSTTGGTTGTTGASGSAPTTSAAGRTTATTATSTAALVGPTWTLVSYKGAAESVPASASPATITFTADGQAGGTAGCNRYSARYTASGSNLTVTPGPMTQMACADPAVGNQESALTQGLPKVASFSISGDRLTMTDAGGQALFVWKATSATLSGTSWTATGVNNGRGALEGTADTEKLTLSFGEGGKLTGFGGCNQLAGSYTADEAGKTLTISGVAATTSNTCPPTATERESQYVAALGRVSTYEREATTLTLRASDGAMQATYRQA